MKISSEAINWGNKVSLQQIFVFDLRKRNWVDSQVIFESNSTNENLDQHFAYRQVQFVQSRCKCNLDNLLNADVRLIKVLVLPLKWMIFTDGSYALTKVFPSLISR